MSKFAIWIIKRYKIISKYTPRRCRFYPSCSSYAIDAISKYGVFVGLLLFLKRFFRCNLFSKGGIDEVP